MPRVKKSDGDHCPICGCEMEVIVSGYTDNCFIDGRHYEYICFTCHNVPQRHHFNEKTNQLIQYPWRPDKLYNWGSMCSEVGFDKKDEEMKRRVNKSISSVKTCCSTMNAELKSKMIEHSKANELKFFVDPDEPEEKEAKRADPKELRKKSADIKRVRRKRSKS